MMSGVTVTVNVAMKREYFEHDGCPGPNQIAGSETNVGYPHYTTITVADSAEVRPGTEVATHWKHPFSVQHVEGSAYQDMYAINNGQILYPVFMMAGTGSVNTTSSDEHHSGDTIATTYTQLENHSAQGVGEGQLLAQESGAYITQQYIGPDMTHSFVAEQSDSLQAVTADVDGIVAGYTSSVPSPPCSDGRINSSHTVCTLKDTDEWLKRNYEVAKGEILLRSTLQSHYHRHCRKNNLHPVSIPVLGRRVRNVFPGVESRRLGKRGDTKYHYCGIRVISGSAKYQLSEESNPAACSRPSSQLLCKLPSGSGGKGSAIQKTEIQYEQHLDHSPSSNYSNSSLQYHYHSQGSQKTSHICRHYRICRFQSRYPE
jgi:hypothetical protein